MPRLILAALIALGSVFICKGCGSSGSSGGLGVLGGSAFKKPDGLYYEATMIRTPAPKPNERATLISSLPKMLKGRTVYRRVSGRDTKVLGGVNQLNQLSHAELRALWLAQSPKLKGAELDLKVRLYGQDTVPVTVWVDLRGAMTVEEGRWHKVKIPADASAVESRWGLGPLKTKRGAKWSKRALRSIDLGLSHLSQAERDVIKGIPFVRKQKGKRAQQAALYVQSAKCAATIQVFNRAIKSERYTFSGEAQRALPATVHSIVHEVGHAIHNRPGRRAQCEYLGLINEYNKLVKRHNKARGAKRNRLSNTLKQKKRRLETLEPRVKSWMKTGPVLNAFKRVRGKRTGPTPYGNTSLAESFAESFALYRVDPDALKRAMPDVYQWFKSGEHVKLARREP